MKILFYNWVPVDDDEKRGGGVSIYQRNLIEALVAKGWQVDFFSSGLAHDLEDDAPRFAPTRNSFEPACRSFELVNSPVLAPGHAAFGQNQRLFERGAADRAWRDFLRRTGPYDILHFNNIEGIPFSFLDVKDEFPATTVVLSHHNYFALCPQVNLWQREARHCQDFDSGRKCVDCLVWRPPRAEVLGAQQLATAMRRNGLTAQSPTFRRAFASNATTALFREMALRSRPAMLPDDPLPQGAEIGQGFARRRAEALALINRAVDLNLAVSERVARVIGAYGIDASRTHVSYIGTKHGEALQSARKRLAPALPGTISMAYLGYMRADKGFFFLLDALEALPASTARNLRLRLAAKSLPDKAIKRRLKALAGRLGALEHVDGYAHDDLPWLLEDIDLGVVPVLWEDNLPQVALEMMAQGLPLLTSDRGGAQELGGNPDFVFAAGSTASFADALRRLQLGEVRLADYWAGAMGLRSMEQHVGELLALYQAARAAKPAARAARAATAGVLTPEELTRALPAPALTDGMHSHA